MAKNENNEFFEITPEILELTELCKSHSTIDTSLYAKYDVKRGLRDINGKGVLTGLTEISDIISSKMVDGKTVPCEGKLYYRGIDVEELVAGFLRENRFGFAETVYLLYYYINEIAYTRDYERVNRKFGRYLLEKEDQGLQLAQELDRISAAVTQTLDPHQARLRYFFEMLPGTDEKTCCCLAHTMLVATPLNCTDIDSFAAELLRMFRYMSGIGFKINDMNTMGLVLEPLDPQEEPEPLQVQLERLPCSMEARWEILRVLTEFETYLRELTELLRPVAEQLAAEMQALTERNRAQLAIWEKYFQTHSVDTFQQEMFRASYLFTQEMQPDEVWIALWNFNMVGFWTEWFESGGKTVRIAYLGANLSFEFAAAHQVRPDAETLCAMMRALTGKDKLEILRRCAAEPFSAAQLAASMNLNSGTVSRNVYGLYKLGYLETRGDGERVNYITRPDALERLFRWVLEYVSEQK